MEVDQTAISCDPREVMLDSVDFPTIGSSCEREFIPAVLRVGAAAEFRRFPVPSRHIYKRVCAAIADEIDVEICIGMMSPKWFKK